MRQRNFLVGLLFAILTFATLSWAFGSRHHRWHHGWHSDTCYESSGQKDNDGGSRQQESLYENNSNDERHE